ncbi:MAG: outer membrane beta-barrel protein [Hyphomicrobiales bacterium]
MRRLIIILLLLASISTTVKSQHTPYKFSVIANANIAFPLYSYSDIFDLGYGLNAGINYSLPYNLEAFIDFGYYQWNFSSEYLSNQSAIGEDGELPNTEANTSFNAFKIYPGMRYYFRVKDIRPYVEATFAVLFVKFAERINLPYYPQYPMGVPIYPDVQNTNKVKTGASAGIGVLYNFTKRISSDASLSYSSIFQRLHQEYVFGTPDNSTREVNNATFINNIVFSLGVKISL